LHDEIVTELFAATVHVATLDPHEAQLMVPFVAVCKPFPAIQEVIVIELFAATVHVAALVPHKTQLVVPFVAVCKP